MVKLAKINMYDIVLTLVMFVNFFKIIFSRFFCAIAFSMVKLVYIDLSISKI